MPSLGTSLTNRNAAAVLRDGLTRVAQGDIAVDCAGLAQVDSSAVAVLLGWQRAAAGRGQSLSITNVPSQLGELATLYGVAELLGLHGRSTAATDPHHRH